MADLLRTPIVDSEWLPKETLLRTPIVDSEWLPKETDRRGLTRTLPPRNLEEEEDREERVKIF